MLMDEGNDRASTPPDDVVPSGHEAPTKARYEPGQQLSTRMFTCLMIMLNDELRCHQGGTCNDRNNRSLR